MLFSLFPSRFLSHSHLTYSRQIPDLVLNCTALVISCSLSWTLLKVRQSHQYTHCLRFLVRLFMMSLFARTDVQATNIQMCRCTRRDSSLVQGQSPTYTLLHLILHLRSNRRVAYHVFLSVQSPLSMITLLIVSYLTVLHGRPRMPPARCLRLDGRNVDVGRRAVDRCCWTSVVAYTGV